MIDAPTFRQNLARHLAEVTHLDALLGDLRTVLAEENLAHNTLVLFCSEQGNAFPFSKWTCFDDGLATGIVAVLPDVIPANRSCGQLMWLADIAPTLVEAAGGTFSMNDFDGRSQWINFQGGDRVVHRYAYGAFTNCNIIDNRNRVYPIRSIRDERYTLIWSPRHDEEITSNTTLTQALKWWETGETKGAANAVASWVVKARQTDSQDDDRLIERLYHRPAWALYDRRTDPQELNNLADDPARAPLLARLKTDLKSWLARWNDSDPVATERAFLNRD